LLQGWNWLVLSGSSACVIVVRAGRAIILTQGQPNTVKPAAGINSSGTSVNCRWIEAWGAALIAAAAASGAFVYAVTPAFGHVRPTKYNFPNEHTHMRRHRTRGHFHYRRVSNYHNYTHAPCLRQTGHHACCLFDLVFMLRCFF
jgi:hypothetical protein